MKMPSIPQTSLTEVVKVYLQSALVVDVEKRLRSSTIQSLQAECKEKKVSASPSKLTMIQRLHHIESTTATASTPKKTGPKLDFMSKPQVC